MKVVAAQETDPRRPASQVDELIARRERFSAGHLTASSAKIFLDGVLEGRTAALLEPYEGERRPRHAELVRVGTHRDRAAPRRRRLPDPHARHRRPCDPRRARRACRRARGERPIRPPPPYRASRARRSRRHPAPGRARRVRQFSALLDVRRCLDRAERRAADRRRRARRGCTRSAPSSRRGRASSRAATGRSRPRIRFSQSRSA